MFDTREHDNQTYFKSRENNFRTMDAKEAHKFLERKGPNLSVKKNNNNLSVPIYKNQQSTRSCRSGRRYYIINVLCHAMSLH